MTARKVLKWMHLVATVWFIACAGYLVAVSLRQTGLRWWLVFSLSGYSTVLIAILVSLYLFALFRGIAEARRIEIEHPLTSTECYLVFYVLTPLFGGLLGTAWTVDAWAANISLFRIAMGTLKTTFLVWVVIDPLLGIMETFLPASRRHRTERLAGRGQ